MDDLKSPSSLSLSAPQRELLQALVHYYTDDQRPVKRETLATEMGCHGVTVSTRMQNLRALQLVTSTSGPKGGYKPTSRAYNVLADRQFDRTVDIPITSGGVSIEEVNIEEIALPAVHDPDQCRGELSIAGAITVFGVGDTIRIGPLPVTNLCIEGIVVEKAPATDTVVIDIEAMHIPSSDQSPGAENEAV